MASLGLLTADSLASARYEKRSVWLGRGVLASCLLVVLLGFSPKSDVAAHVGGFVAGILLGVIALQCRKLLLKPHVNAVTFCAALGLVLSAWWLALR
jgi:hypothetical protein